MIHAQLQTDGAGWVARLGISYEETPKTKVVSDTFSDGPRLATQNSSISRGTTRTPLVRRDGPEGLALQCGGPGLLHSYVRVKWSLRPSYCVAVRHGTRRDLNV